MPQVKEKQNTAFEALKDTLGVQNRMAAPRLEKVVVSVGTGKLSRTNKQWNEFIAERLTRITGQKPSPRPAHKSIASFKIREGETIGHKVTLRGERMYAFLDRLFNVAIPRMRDFRGLSRKNIDEMGNLTIGIREHNIFPETSQEELKDIFGFSVTLVSTALTREDGIAFFEHLGVPFKKDE